MFIKLQLTLLKRTRHVILTSCLSSSSSHSSREPGMLSSPNVYQAPSPTPQENQAYYPHLMFMKLQLTLLKRTRHVILTSCLSSSSSHSSREPGMLSSPHVYEAPAHTPQENQACYPHLMFIKLQLTLNKRTRHVILTSCLSSSSSHSSREPGMLSSPHVYQAPAHTPQENQACYPHLMFIKLQLTLLKRTRHVILTSCLSSSSSHSSREPGMLSSPNVYQVPAHTPQENQAYYPHLMFIKLHLPLLKRTRHVILTSGLSSSSSYSSREPGMLSSPHVYQAPAHTPQENQACYPHLMFIKFQLTLLKRTRHIILTSGLSSSISHSSREPGMLSSPHVYQAPAHTPQENQACYPHLMFIKLQLTLLKRTRHVILTSCLSSSSSHSSREPGILSSPQVYQAPSPTPQENQACYPHLMFIKLQLTLLKRTRHVILQSQHLLLPSLPDPV